MTNDTRPVRIIRAAHESDFFVCSRRTAQDMNITYEALGVLIYLLSKPVTWEANVTDIAKRSTEYKTYKVLRELRKAGYLTLQKEKGKGRFSQWVYQVYETSQLLENQQVEIQVIENQHTKRIGNKKDRSKPSKDNSDNTSAAKAAGGAFDINRVFDCVAWGSFEIKDMSALRTLPGEKKNPTAARIGTIKSWIIKHYPNRSEPEIARLTVDFYKWYREKMKGKNAPRDISKFCENWVQWEQSPLPDPKPEPEPAAESDELTPEQKAMIERQNKAFGGGR